MTTEKTVLLCTVGSAGDGETGPWQSTRDYEIESMDRGIDIVVSPIWDHV